MNSLKKYALVTASYLLFIFIIITIDVFYLKSQGNVKTHLGFDNDSIVFYLVAIGGSLLMLITTFWLNRKTKTKKLCRSAIYKLHLGVLIISLLSLIIVLQTSYNLSIGSGGTMKRIAHSISDGNTPLRFVTFGFLWSVIMSAILLMNALRTRQFRYIFYSILFLPILGVIYFLIEV